MNHCVETGAKGAFLRLTTVEMLPYFEARSPGCDFLSFMGCLVQILNLVRNDVLHFATQGEYLFRESLQGG